MHTCIEYAFSFFSNLFWCDMKSANQGCIEILRIFSICDNYFKLNYTEKKDLAALITNLVNSTSISVGRIRIPLGITR